MDGSGDFSRFQNGSSRRYASESNFSGCHPDFELATIQEIKREDSHYWEVAL